MCVVQVHSLLCTVQHSTSVVPRHSWSLTQMLLQQLTLLLTALVGCTAGVVCCQGDEAVEGSCHVGAAARRSRLGNGVTCTHPVHTRVTPAQCCTRGTSALDAHKGGHDVTWAGTTHSWYYTPARYCTRRQCVAHGMEQCLLGAQEAVGCRRGGLALLPHLAVRSNTGRWCPCSGSGSSLLAPL
jgi:hypothetical protein